MTVAHDAGTARLVIPAALPSGAVTSALLAACAREAGVEITASVATSLLDAANDYGGAAFDGEIARAVPAVQGADERLVWAEGRDPHPRCARASIDEDGRVDHYDRTPWVRVKSGERVAEVVPATRGSDGRDVLGGRIPARPGRRNAFELDCSVRLEPDNSVIALTAGVLRAEGGLVRVTREMLVRGSIDFSTGNVDFDGSVFVREGVRDRFEVRVTEDLFVGDLVEAARLVVGGRLELECGMAGKHRGTIDVSGDAAVGYLDDVTGRVQGLLVVERGLLNCTLAIGRGLVVRRGAIIGGDIDVVGPVHVAAMGSDADAETRMRLRGASRPRGAEPAAGAASLLVEGVIHPNVTISVDGRAVRVTTPLEGPLQIGLDPRGDIAWRRRRGPWYPLASVARPVPRVA